MTRISKQKKIVIYAASALFTAFVIYCGLWFLNYKSYDRYIDSQLKVLPYSSTSFVDRTGEMIYGVKKPSFLSFTGNLASVSGDNSLNFILWPTFMCKQIDDIGLIISDSRGSYMIYINENLEYNPEKNIGYSPEEEHAIKSLLEKRHDDIAQQYQQTKIKFSIQ